MIPINPEPKRPCFWANTKDELRSLPTEVRKDLGFELHRLETGNQPLHFDALPEIGDGVMEIKVRHCGEAYRLLYVVKFPEAIYVLLVVHKKSTKGRKLPEKDKNLARKRYNELRAERRANGLE